MAAPASSGPHSEAAPWPTPAEQLGPEPRPSALEWPAGSEEVDPEWADAVRRYLEGAAALAQGGSANPGPSSRPGQKKQ
eukprot:7243902-Alexandrium_andersonii.AAC.1